MNDKSNFLELFSKTYPCDGFNAIDSVHDSIYAEYMDHPLTLWTSFLGIPNRPLSVDKRQSARNILTNLPLLLLPWNLLGFVPTLLVNILKLVTEFLPFFAAYKLNDMHYDYRKPVLMRVLAGWGALFFNAIGLLLRCITSPVTSMRAALAYGFREHPYDSVQAKVTGGLLAALSLAMTIAAFVILFPFVVYPLAAPVAAVASAYLPAGFISAFLAVKPYLEIIGVGIEAVLGVTLMPAATGLAAIAGVVFATVGSAVSRLMTKMANWYYHGHESIQEAERARLLDAINYEDSAEEKPLMLALYVRENYLDENSPIKQAEPTSRLSTYVNLMSGTFKAESAGVWADSESDTQSDATMGETASESISAGSSEEAASQSMPHRRLSM